MSVREVLLEEISLELCDAEGSREVIDTGFPLVVSEEAGRLLLVDISAPEFDPTPLGISREELMYQMHAIDADGRTYRNVEAFWAIWQAFPAATGYGLLGRLVTLPLLHPLARLGYRIFARLRRYLPQRERDCSTGSCRIGRNAPR